MRLVAVTAVLALVGCSRAPLVPPLQRSGHQYCRVVYTAQPWRTGKHREEPCYYLAARGSPKQNSDVFGVARGSDGHFFALVSRYEGRDNEMNASCTPTNPERIMADNPYFLPFDRSRPGRTVGVDDWLTARPTSRDPGLAGWSSEYEPGRKLFRFRGRDYPYAGKYAFGRSTSDAGAVFVVSSYEESRAIHWQAYLAATGEELARFELSGTPAQFDVLQEVQFFDDYLVVSQLEPLTENIYDGWNHFIFCDFSPLRPAAAGPQTPAGLDKYAFTITPALGLGIALPADTLIGGGYDNHWSTGRREVVRRAVDWWKLLEPVR